jgi:hypothetical protein
VPLYLPVKPPNQNPYLSRRLSTASRDVHWDLQVFPMSNRNYTATLTGLSVQHLLITTDLCRSRNSLPLHKPPSKNNAVVSLFHAFARDHLAWAVSTAASTTFLLWHPASLPSATHNMESPIPHYDIQACVVILQNVNA